MKSAPQNCRQVRRSRPFQRPQAFTLIELLVVISIIALLIGILLPALGAARYQARSLACATQQQQISRAMATYTNDNDSYLPTIRDLQFGQLSWDDKLGVGGYDGRSNGAFTDDSGSNSKGRYMFVRPSDFYVCPLDDFERLPFAWAPDQIAPRTYALAFRQAADATDHASFLASNNSARGPVGLFFSLRIEDVRDSSTSILMSESLNIGAGQTLATNILGAGNKGELYPWGHADVATGVPPRAIGHHRTNSDGPTGTAQEGYTPNYLFIDSHVENLSNEVTFENKRGTFDFRDSMWDATK